MGYADDDRFEVICTCGWMAYGFPTNVVEEYAEHQLNAYRGVL